MFVWLSVLRRSSGPIIGVGEMSSLYVASLWLRVLFNQAFCSEPQMVLSGPSGVAFGLR